MNPSSDWLSSRNMKASAIVLLSILSLFFFVKTISQIKQFGLIGANITPSRTITVSGKGDVYATPDIATFSLSGCEWI